MVVNFEGGARKLSPEDAASLPLDHLVELGAESPPFSIRKLTQGIPSPDRDLDGSRCSHTSQYTNTHIPWKQVGL